MGLWSNYCSPWNKYCSPWNKYCGPWNKYCGPWDNYCGPQNNYCGPRNNYWALEIIIAALEIIIAAFEKIIAALEIPPRPMKSYIILSCYKVNVRLKFLSIFSYKTWRLLTHKSKWVFCMYFLTSNQVCFMLGYRIYKLLMKSEVTL